MNDILILIIVLVIIGFVSTLPDRLYFNWQTEVCTNYTPIYMQFQDASEFNYAIFGKKSYSFDCYYTTTDYNQPKECIIRIFKTENNKWINGTTKCEIG